MWTTFHYPESLYGRTYADVITKISRMDSLPNYLSYGALLARALRAQGAPLRRIRKYLSRRSTETPIHAFVSSRVDYCNSLLYGLPAYQLNKLQRVQNAAARLILQESKYCHVRPLLCNLPWLPVKFRIDFKIILLTYKAVNGLAAFYPQEFIYLKEACKYKLRSHCDGLLLNPVKFNVSRSIICRCCSSTMEFIALCN